VGGRREERKGREGEGKERMGKGMGEEIKEGGKEGTGSGPQFEKNNLPSSYAWYGPVCAPILGGLDRRLGI